MIQCVRFSHCIDNMFITYFFPSFKVITRENFNFLPAEMAQFIVYRKVKKMLQIKIKFPLLR